MKKRWIALGVGVALLCGGGYLLWREVLGGRSALAGRDFNAERTALLERMQTDDGRKPGAANACDVIVRWKATERRIIADLKKQWADRGEELPGIFPPLRGNTTHLTPEARKQVEAADAAWAVYYPLAREAGIDGVLDEIAAAPRAARRLNGPRDENDRFGADLRHLARLCRYRMTLAADAKDPAAYRAACRHLLAIATVSARQHTVIDRLVAAAILALANSAVADDVESGAITPALAADCAAMITSSYEGWPKWANVFEGEEIDGMHAMVLNRSVGPFGSSEVARIRRSYADLARGIDLPRAQRIPVFDAVDADVASAPRWHVRYRLLMPAIVKIGRTKDQTETQLAGLRAVVAVERYRVAKGELPSSLNALVPEFLPAVPADPFGTVLLYKRLDNSAGAAPAYLVYSVGFDQTDNGGAVHPKGWYHALSSPPESTGYDYPLNGPAAK